MAYHRQRGLELALLGSSEERPDLIERDHRLSTNDDCLKLRAPVQYAHQRELIDPEFTYTLMANVDEIEQSTAPARRLDVGHIGERVPQIAIMVVVDA